MRHLVALARRPCSAVDANENIDVALRAESSGVMLTRIQKIMRALNLMGSILNPVYSTTIPVGMPRAFFPDPNGLFAAMGREMSAREYCRVCRNLFNWRENSFSTWLMSKLYEEQVKPDPTSLEAWSSRVRETTEGTINVYEVGLAFTRFQTDEVVYNLSAQVGRQPLVGAGYIPGGLLEWVIGYTLFPDLKTEIVRVCPLVIHPGTGIRGGGDWSIVSGCNCRRGQSECCYHKSDFVDSKTTLFALR